MRDLKVTVVQANQVWEDKAANYKNYERLLNDCDSSDLIVLPEMFNTAFSMNANVLAEEFETSEAIEWLKNSAKTKNSAFYTSLMIQQDGKFFNRGVFIEPTGKITFYDKRKRFAMAGEDKVFSAGEKEVIVEYKNWKINLQICYDLRFPENVRNESLNGKVKYDAIIYVANWPERRVHHWNSLLVARAIENQSYVIGVNRVGVDGTNLNYSGNSVIVNPLGELLLKTKEFEEEVITATINVDFLTEIRENLPFLKDC